MKNKYLLGILALVLAGGATYFFISGKLLQGKLPIITSGFVCPATSTTVFEGDINTTDEFMTLLESLEGGVACPYRLSANMEPYSGSYHTNVWFECDDSTLEIIADETTDDYQIECTQETDGSTQEMRANLTIERDSSGAISSTALGVNMDLETEHTNITNTLDPDTLTITRLSSSNY